jgi:hypothetical protein
VVIAPLGRRQRAEAAEVGSAARETIGLLPAQGINVQAVELRRLQDLLHARAAAGNSLRLMQLFEADARDAGEDLTKLVALARRFKLRRLLLLNVGRLGDTIVLRLRLYDVAQESWRGSWQEVLQGLGLEGIEAAFDRMIAGFAPARQVAPTPIYKKWWFWTIAGAVVAGTVTAAIVGSRSSGREPDFVIRPP